MIDPTTLYEAAAGILSVLEDSALAIGWEPVGCVTVGPPALTCDHIAVWPQTLTPERTAEGPCQIINRVTFAIYVGQCVDEANAEDSSWWEAESIVHHPRIWALYTGINQAIVDGSLVAGCSCKEIIPGPWTLLDNSGGVAIWAASITVGLDPVLIGS